jgi:hypothetical protein
MSVPVAIRTERTSYAPADQISGTVEVLEPVHARQLTLALEYRDWTADYRAATRVLALDAPLHTGDLEQGANFPFTVQLPADALPNQTGTFGRTGWGLHARIDRFGLDANVWHLLDVPAPVRAGVR